MWTNSNSPPLSLKPDGNRFDCLLSLCFIYLCTFYVYIYEDYDHGTSEHERIKKESFWLRQQTKPKYIQCHLGSKSSFISCLPLVLVICMGSTYMLLPKRYNSSLQ